MEEETRYTKQDLETMRAWTLQRKIQVTQTRLIEWLGRYDWNVYVSFSGGKDSTVLADLAARVYQVFSCPKRQDPLRLVFVNTGLEYPEIQKFVRDFAEWLKAKYKIPVELEILHPSMTFPQVLSKYGYGQVIVHQDVVLAIFRVQHITPGIDGFNRTVRKCNVEGRTAVIDGIRALAFGNACNLPVKAAGSQNDKNFISLFGSDFHICPNAVHGIGVKIILRRQFLRFGRVQIDKSAAAGGEGRGKHRRKDKR